MPKRRSLFTRPQLSALTTIHDSREREKEPRASSSPILASGVLKKKRSPSFHLINGSTPPKEPDVGIEEYVPSPDGVGAAPQPASRGSSGRPTSVFGSFRSLRSNDFMEEPLTSTSSNAPSVNWGDALDNYGRSRNVIYHGEVQTSSSLFRKKKEYLVLTETHILRFKNCHRAAESFPIISPPPVARRLTNPRHSSSPSIGSQQELQTVNSEHSGEERPRDFGTPLRQIVAVYKIDDGRPFFAIEFACLDEEANNGSTMMIQFNAPDERDSWLTHIRAAADAVRLADTNPISPRNSNRCARVVEREGDYEPPNYAIYKVVQRPAKSTGRNSSDDLTKIATTVCFMAIGVHKVHLIPLARGHSSSSVALSSLNVQGAYGIMTMTNMRVREEDDGFELTFRMPLQPPKVLYLASLASRDIAIRLRHVETFLRPEWESRPYMFMVPEDVRREILAERSPERVPEDYFDRTLTAYCIAYNLRPRNIRYGVLDSDEDSPHFVLYPPEDPKQKYSTLELLAVMRALRYNECFGTVSFAGVVLDSLNMLGDAYGEEHLCTRTKRGSPVSLDHQVLRDAHLLIQEVRAMAMTNRRLRRMDFTGCIKRVPKVSDNPKYRDPGCGIVEALFPLCRAQATNVDWISLNHIQLADSDLDYLVGAASERLCHFRGLEMSCCGLTDRTMSLTLDALRAQENTLEALDISDNQVRLSPLIFEPEIRVFGFIRRLDLSKTARTSAAEPLISFNTLKLWRLQMLRLSQTVLNTQDVASLAQYLQTKHSSALRELHLDQTTLTGGDIATLMYCMAHDVDGEARERDLYLDISQNRPTTAHRDLAEAIAQGWAPTRVSLRYLEYSDEAQFRELVRALGKNNSIRWLDISRCSLPSDASEDTCRELEKMFARNSTLLGLDISGENSRLEQAKIGVGINHALCGLMRNNTLQTLQIRNQNLGVQGASTLADVLKVNTALRVLECDDNNISLPGFTDLVNALYHNTTLTYMSPMLEAREAHFRMTEQQIRQASEDASKQHPASPPPAPRRGPPVHLTEQDIGAALRLVEESWDRQAYRLAQYLARNAAVAAGVTDAAALAVDDEVFERPGSAGPPTGGAGSASRSGSGLGMNGIAGGGGGCGGAVGVPPDVRGLMEKVVVERTPTVEKDGRLGVADGVDGSVSRTSLGHVRTESEEERMAWAAEVDKRLDGGL
ncbi:hypothetical protein BDY21DRAFT_392022 [Lineolata rhizophorae]|uniref:PH domain-containing protein n=1 Tax=Lineolata rhizophorae TaxID=578093 RepID=A0A6A6NZW6_9PEZI|nr:hypothetical protein BDY21DRAFT_392022 [Lineolata rhizophorae]